MVEGGGQANRRTNKGANTAAAVACYGQTRQKAHTPPSPCRRLIT
jgi:hypothetical protein